MKLLFDQNLSWKLVKSVSKSFPGSTHVLSLGLSEKSDKEIWEFAKKKDSCVITKDNDFDQLSFLYGYPPKCVRLQIGNVTTEKIVKILEANLDRIHSFGESDDALLIVQSD
jgi:predicted nuclease of predicted toxin-antitoxin system